VHATKPGSVWDQLIKALQAMQIEDDAIIDKASLAALLDSMYSFECFTQMQVLNQCLGESCTLAR
jgi:hypothetical protein